MKAPGAWDRFLISSVARRGPDPLLEALWTHAAAALAEETPADDADESWRP